MAKLSIIIPFVNEWPQVAFTVRNIAEELKGRVDFEIVVVDNWCYEMEADQRRLPDRGHDRFIKQDKTVIGLYDIKGQRNATHVVGHLKAMAQTKPWLKYVQYDEKLSHWNSKRVGIENASGDYLMHIDAHCIVARDTIHDMFKYYLANENTINGSLHPALTYHILEGKRLIYKPVINFETDEYHYSFTALGSRLNTQFEVAAMSTCGMMVSRRIYNAIGGWPKALGIYGGGENFFNYSLAVCGFSKWIYGSGTLFHHGETRGYHWNGDDYLRNRMVATYLFGGEKILHNMVQHSKGNPLVKERLAYSVLNACDEHRKVIRERQMTTLPEWAKGWLP